MGVRIPSMISSAKQILKLQPLITREKPDVPKGHIAIYVGETQRKSCTSHRLQPSTAADFLRSPPNPEPNLSLTRKEPYQDSPVMKKKNLKFSLPAIIGAVLGSGATVSICLLFSFIFWRQKRIRSNRKKSMERRKASPLPDSLCQCFTLAAIQEATSNFDDSFVIGRGGFGELPYSLLRLRV
ncbi:hypothetical protein PTKIN_Ptkin02bG0206600 [Pterospermum kingtungense]